MNVCCVVGARPNFMKAAPVVESLRKARRVTSCARQTPCETELAIRLID